MIMNPFNQNTQNSLNLTELAKTKNPMELIMNMAQTNPAYKPILDALRSGVNPQQLFYQMCQQRGINPQDVLNQIK